jgi:sugar phosphate isomerase/epimerase
MYNIEKRDKIPSTSNLSKLGITAIGYTAGGVFLFILQMIGRLRGLGLVLGGIVCVIGIFSLMSKDPEDRKAGAVIAAAGVLTVLSKNGIPFITTISGTLLTIGAFGLLAIGILNGIKFLIGLKKRS